MSVSILMSWESVPENVNNLHRHDSPASSTILLVETLNGLDGYFNDITCVSS